MARVDLPQSKLRARKRRRRVRIAVFCVVVVLLFGGGLVALSRAPFLRVTAVDVSGTRAVATSSIVSLAEHDMTGDYYLLFPRDDIFLYPKRTIESDVIADYPAVKSADVHAQDFHTVAVSVVERQPVAQWCPSDMLGSSTFPTMGAEGHDCDLMDNDGVVYAPAGEFGSTQLPQGAVTYFGALSGTAEPQQFVTPGEFGALSALVNALSQSQGTTTVGTVWVGGQDVEAQFSDGFILKFLLSDASGDVFERFSLALKSDPFTSHPLSDFQYLDLRFGDKLYYKLKGE